MSRGPSTSGERPQPLHEKLAELVAAGRPSFSFEFSPPKDEAGEVALWDTIRRLEALSPTFVSVTYGAGGSNRDKAVSVTGRIAEDTTLTPMGHLTCVGNSRSQLRGVIGQYAGAGVNSFMALRGDPPGGLGTEWTPHPEGLRRGLDLIALLRESGEFSVGAPAFPDKHPEASDLDHDARVLAAKVRAGAQFAVTQFFFDPATYFGLMDRLTALGVDIPVIPGIMPVTNLKQVQRMALMSGAPMPAAMTSRLEAVADQPVEVRRRVGVEIATELSLELLAGGAPGLHFYTLNRSPATLDVWQGLTAAAAVPA